jgi:hypothetical protein
MSHNTINYYCKAKKDNIIEVPQTLKLNLLPPLRGIQPKNLIIQMWPGWLVKNDSSKIKKMACDDLVKCGVTEIGRIAHDSLKNFVQIDFQGWNLDFGPYLNEHPDAARIDFNGRKCNKEDKKNEANVCSTLIINHASVHKYLDKAMTKWMKKWRYPYNAVWDFESRY